MKLAFKLKGYQFHLSIFRFSIKQERFDNIGQWKHTEAINPEWNKQALSWPVKQDGQYNEVSLKGKIRSFLSYFDMSEKSQSR